MQQLSKKRKTKNKTELQSNPLFSLKHIFQD